MSHIEEAHPPSAPAPREPSSPCPLTLIVGVHLVLLDSGKVLLGLRRNTSFAENQWHVPAGHMEAGESVLRSTAREAEEELGLTIAEDDLVLAHTLHHLDADDGRSRLQLFFRPTRYSGEIGNREPEKCHELRWWDLAALPDETVPYTAHALAGIAAGRAMSVTGWPA